MGDTERYGNVYINIIISTHSTDLQKQETFCFLFLGIQCLRFIIQNVTYVFLILCETVGTIVYKECRLSWLVPRKITQWRITKQINK